MAHGSMSSGRDADYLISKVGTASGRYLLDGAGKGERPGEWIGRGSALIGLTGEVQKPQWEALIGHRKDPRDPRFADPDTGHLAAAFGSAARGSGKGASVDDQLAAAIAAAPHPLTPEEVSALRSQIAEAVQSAQILYDEFTYSVQKSVSTLKFVAEYAAAQATAAGDTDEAALWMQRHDGLQDAIDAGAKAAFNFIEEHAGATRAGRHGDRSGTARFVKAGLIGAAFPQRTSQDGDPQEHVHMPIARRTLDDEGKVRATDTMGIRAAHRAATEHGNRVMLEKALALPWGLSLRVGKTGIDDPDGPGRDTIEIDGVTDAEMAALSSRVKMIRPKEQALVADFRSANGRAPSPRELYRLKQYATKVTRRKAVEESRPEMMKRLAERCAKEEAGGLARIAARFRADQMPAAAEPLDRRDVIDRAVDAVQTGKASWTAFDLYEAVVERLPVHLGVSDDAALQRLGWGLVSEGLARPDVRQIGEFDLPYEVPTVRQRPDGTSMYLREHAGKFVTVGHLDAEATLLKSSLTASRVAVSEVAADAWIEANCVRGDGTRELTPGQEVALRGVLTSGAARTNLVGPAGTGKSFVVGKLAQAWPELTGGRVVGLATTERATRVLHHEGLTNTVNVAKFLDLRRSQEVNPHRTPSDEQRTWTLQRGDLLVLDEASMTDTADARAIRDYVEADGAQWAATGDPRQLGSVNAGGWFATSCAAGGFTYQLDDVMRFSGSAWPGEGEASLRLRDGDTSVIREYGMRGRIVAATTPEEGLRLAADRYVTQRLLGRVGVVTVATNDQASQVSSFIRARFVELGYVTDEAGTVDLGRDANAAGVGDQVMCRLNDRSSGVTNRLIYTLQAVHADGSIDVLHEETGLLHRLPAVYVQTNTQLGYASTAHAAEGITVTGEAITVDSPQLDRSALYVGATRSKSSNVIIVPTVEVDARGKPVEGQEPREAEAILAGRLMVERTEPSAHDVRAESHAEQRDAYRVHGRLEEHVHLIGVARTSVYLDRLEADGKLSADVRDRFREESATSTLADVLRVAEQAGMDPETVLRDAIGSGNFQKIDSVSQATIARITRPWDGVPPPPDRTSGDMPKDTPDDMARGWTQLRSLADDRHRELGGDLAEQPPEWLTAVLGDVPQEPLPRLDWELRAGQIAYSREVARLPEDSPKLLGSAPGISRPEARSVWHDAHVAAGRPETHKQETEMSDGRLRARALAAENLDRWAPDHSDGALEAAAEAVYELERQQADALARNDDAGAVEANVLGEQARLAQAEWDAVVQARAEFTEHSRETREAARRAVEEMDRRGITRDAPGTPTASEWLDDERAATESEDESRHVTEVDIDESVDVDAMEVEPAVDGDGLPVMNEYLPQPEAREQVHRGRGHEGVPDDLERARSLAAAEAAIRESTFQRAQVAAWEVEEAVRRRNEVAENEARSVREVPTEREVAPAASY